jgi:ATP-dependent Clp protease ATP-binding subunit ClpC
MFFARQAATLSGSIRIESEHLLFGLVREGGPSLLQLLPATSERQIRERIPDQTSTDESSSPPLIMPLSEECKWIVAYAAEEADTLKHRQIAAEHILLAILREDSCAAARMLSELGARLEVLRQRIASETPHEDSWEVRS